MRTAVLITMVLASGVAQASSPPRDVEIFVMPGGDFTINSGPVLSFKKFKAQMEPLLRQKPCGDFHIRSGSDTPFEAIGRVVLLLQQGGCAKVGFLTEPTPIRN